MTESIPHLFANLTAALEDLHRIAVDGQAADLSPDIQFALVRNLRSGIVGLDGIATAIAVALGEASQ